MTAPKTSKSIKSLSVANEVFPNLIEYYKRAYKAKKSGSTKIVYHTGNDPVVIDYAMGLIPMFPENFAAACGAVQVAPALIEVTENLGAPEDLCSYFKTHYGFMKGEFSDEMNQLLARIRLQEPDVVVSLKNVCRLHPLWMKIVSEHYGVPYFSLDAPVMPPRYDKNPLSDAAGYGFHYGHEVGQEAVDYCVEQIKAYIAFLEEHTGQRMDWGRLRETVALASELYSMFNRILELRTSVPCPAGGEDLNTLVFFLVCLPGTEVAVDVVGRALKEVEDRVAAGTGVLPQERFRLIFDGIPPWFNMGLFNYLHKFGGVSVEEGYPRAWVGKLDPDNPLESIAVKHMLTSHHTATYGYVAERFQQRVQAYQADGGILWNLATCRLIACNAVPRSQTALEQACDVPALVLDADQVDPRRYAEAQILARIDAFMEMLEQRKYGGRAQTA